MSVANKLLQRGVLLDAASMDAGDLDWSCLHAEISQLEIRPLTNVSELSHVLRNRDVVICNKVKLGRQILLQNSHIKLISIAATGSNNIDLDTAHELNIAVANVLAYATPSVVQHVFAMLLSLTTRLTEIRGAINSGEWSRSPHFSLLQYPVHELAGKKLGIIGYGELGQAVARVAECFGMQVLVAQRDALDTRKGRLPLHALLSQIDVLSIHCPLTNETKNLIAEREFKLMKPTALLINTARGGIVDEVALLHAVQTKIIAGAALDVLSVEPPPADHILLQCQLPNLIITPHVAWAAREARQRCVNEIALNIAAFKRNEMRNRL